MSLDKVVASAADAVVDVASGSSVAVGGFGLNVALNVWFVHGLGWGIAGSAWGTVRGLLPVRFPRPLAEPYTKTSHITGSARAGWCNPARLLTSPSGCNIMTTSTGSLIPAAPDTGPAVSPNWGRSPMPRRTGTRRHRPSGRLGTAAR